MHAVIAGSQKETPTVDGEVGIAVDGVVSRVDVEPTSHDGDVRTCFQTFSALGGFVGITFHASPTPYSTTCCTVVDTAPTGGEIDLMAWRDGEQVKVCVQDCGPGISPDKMEHIFDRFYRGDDHSIAPGFGLGLPIAKALVDGMGGTIAIESELGNVSKVTLLLSSFDVEV